MHNNWQSSTTVAVLSNFRASGNDGRSQIARATITLARKKSTGKPNTTTHMSTHCPPAEKIEKWDHGIVYVETTYDSPMLFFARNDTQRNSVSL